MLRFGQSTMTLERQNLIAQLHMTICLEVTPLPKYEVVSHVCTSRAILRLYSCIFQIWVANSLLHHYCHQPIPAFDAFPTTSPTASLEVSVEANHHQICHGHKMLHKHCRHHDLLSIIVYDLPIHRVYSLRLIHNYHGLIGLLANTPCCVQ